MGCSKKGIKGVQVDVLSVFGNVFGNWSEAQTAELIYVLSYKEYAKKKGGCFKDGLQGWFKLYDQSNAIFLYQRFWF